MHPHLPRIQVTPPPPIIDRRRRPPSIDHHCSSLTTAPKPCSRWRRDVPDLLVLLDLPIPLDLQAHPPRFADVSDLLEMEAVLRRRWGDSGDGRQRVKKMVIFWWRWNRSDNFVLFSGDLLK
ncbi:hypothetical protein OROMI_032356 [Orobanche minor]